MEEHQIKDEKNLNIKLEIELTSDKNNSYHITFEAESSNILIIKATQKNNLFSKCFTNKSTFEKIKENKYFSMCDDLKEIYTELESRIKNKEIKLFEKDNNLVLIINLPSIKIKEISFLLNEDEKNENQKINDLVKITTELKNEINLLKNENKELYQKIEDLKNNNPKEIKELKNIVLEFKKIIEELKINQLYGLSESTILDNDDLTFIKQLFPNKCKFNLLYRATRDGSYPENFHKKCDDKGPTITLIKTNDNKKFGGYISKDRKYGNRDEYYVNDKDAFIFSIKKKKNILLKMEIHVHLAIVQ